jgi:uncharacterized OB-fold protein
MVCDKCGYVMAPFETACPRCTRLKALKQTRRLPDLRSMVTQRLVQLEQCPACKFMLFPGDTHCSSCGALVRQPKSENRGPVIVRERKGQRQRTAQPQVVVGIVVGAVTLLIVAILYKTIVSR